MIGNIQLLRAIAALWVILYHCGLTYFGRSTEFGAVAVFMVLSGYLVAGMTHRTAPAFLLTRSARLLPLYWVLTLLFAFMAGMIQRRYLPDIVTSALLLPVPRTTGFYPVLGVGWTLIVEFMLYGAFALFLAIKTRFCVPLAAAAIIFGPLFLPEDTSPIVRFYVANDYRLFFAFGLVARYFEPAIGFAPVFRSAHAFALAPLLLAGMTASILEPRIVAAVGSDLPHYLAPLAMALGAVALARLGADLQSRTVNLLGRASFGAYLFHPIAIEEIRRHGIALDAWPVALCVAALSFGAGILAVLVFEKPASALFRGLFLIPKALIIRAVATFGFLVKLVV